LKETTKPVKEKVNENELEKLKDELRKNIESERIKK